MVIITDTEWSSRTEWQW